MKQLATLLFLSLLSGCLLAKPTHGTKVGVITSLAEEGILCPTHEGTLIRGGMSAGVGAIASGPVLAFNVADDLFPDAQKAMEDGKEVEVAFFRPIMSDVCNREHSQDVTITAIRVLDAAR